MLKTAVRTTIWIAVILALLTALVGVSPTQAGEFVRDMWANVLEFLRSVFNSSTTT